KFLSLDPNQLEGESSYSQRKVLFREFVTEQLLLQEAEKEKITVKEEEVQRQLHQWLSDTQEVTPDLRQRVRILLKVQKLIKQEIGTQIQIDNQEMYNYYTTHQREFIINDQVHVLEVLVQDRNRADEIRQQLSFGDVRTFKSLARIYSQGLTAEAGGDLGTFERGQLPEDFEKVIFKLKPGEISSVFPSAEGYHIFMMEEWIPRHARKFYEIQDTIFEKLVSDKERVALDQYVKQLFLAASLEILDENLNLNWGDGSANLQ
ncbi:peptidylprolyl isomerase, partial [Acidobacteria bacterium AH-259-D05]|nr:peptidylprolyl isomerase [Acidobacteria bacterium AH-259-D05]